MAQRLSAPRVGRRVAMGVAVGCYLTAVAVLALVTNLTLGTADGRELLLNGAFLAGSGAVVVSAGVRVARRPRSRDDVLLAITASAWLAGNVVWFYYNEVLDSVPYPAWSDVGYLTALVLMTVLLLGHLPRLTGALGRRLLVDIGLTVLGLFTVLWVLYLDRSMEAGGLSPLGKAVSLTYPLADALLVTVAVFALRHGRGRDARLRLIAVALTCYFLADLGWNYTAVHGSYTPGSERFDVLWVAAYGLLAFVPWAPRGGPAGAVHVLRPGLIGLVAPTVGAFLALIVWVSHDHNGIQRADIVLLLAVSGMTILRQVMLARDLVAINRELHDEVARQTRELRESRDRMQELAHRDPLTGLANRRSLFASFDTLVVPALATADGAAPAAGSHALAVLDLDDFKSVNDELGHDVGDQLLIQVARRLQQAARTQDVAARLGGDEFAVLMLDVSPDQVHAIGARLLAALQVPVPLGTGTAHQPGASMGLTTFVSGESPRAVLRRADAAMYDAKREGKRRFAIHPPQDHVPAGT